jgi:UDP-2,3-diacylglucosamine hydrolase
MRVSAISDVHVKFPHDAADRLLSSFFSHPLVLESDYVFLLGDIFDLMCGPHEEYLRIYSHLFEKMNALVIAGKKIYYIEGNHDVHLEKLFKLYWKSGEITPLRAPVTLDLSGKKYYFSHGDEHDVHNVAYHRYMNFIYTPALRFVANHIMPYAVLNFIGERASKISRKKGSKKFDEEKVRLKFRVGVETITRHLGVDFVIGGHSHVKDNSKLESGAIYVNNGYALKSNSFIYINNHEVEFIDMK